MSVITLQEARDAVRSDRAEGTYCPCCDQKVKIYKRHINSTMAQAMIVMWGLGDRWVDIPREVIPVLTERNGGAGGSGDYAKLRHWGLIGRAANHNPKKRYSGWWRLTENGRRFVNKDIGVPEYLFTFNDTKMSVEGDLITIDDALGRNFDYGELMSGARRQRMHLVGAGFK